MTRTITLSDGRKLQYASDEAYERAEAWYNSARYKHEIINFCAERGVNLIQPGHAYLMVEDWADLAMHCWAKSQGLAA